MMIKNFREPPSYLTVSEVALLARVAETSVRRWLMRGELKATRFGGVTRVSVEDLRKFMETSSVIKPHGGDR
jgi:excisionase family DNA binding protein